LLFEGAELDPENGPFCKSTFGVEFPIAASLPDLNVAACYPLQEITGMLPGSGDNRAEIRAVADSIRLLGSRGR
jgi:hypothetical protein